MAKTEIFKNYSEFLAREDKAINGVSQSFLEANPSYDLENSTNKGCWDCSDCSNCSNCRSCSDCSNCRSCSFCSDCSDFKSNPQRVVSPILGSRSAQTTYYFDASKGQIVCGCFKGTLQEFREAVIRRHGIKKPHGSSYLKWIASVEVYIKSLEA